MKARFAMPTAIGITHEYSFLNSGKRKMRVRFGGFDLEMPLTANGASFSLFQCVDFLFEALDFGVFIVKFLAGVRQGHLHIGQRFIQFGHPRLMHGNIKGMVKFLQRFCDSYRL